MLKYIKSIPALSLVTLFAVSIVILLMFYLGGGADVEINGETWNQPTYTNTLLNWTYALMIIAAGITVIVSLVRFVMTFVDSPKKGIQNLLILALFAAVFFVAWGMGSEETLNIIGYDGTDNSGVMARFSDMCLYATYILVGGTILAWLGSALYSKLK